MNGGSLLGVFWQQCNSQNRLLDSLPAKRSKTCRCS